MKVGLIGLGRMGQGMGQRLLGGGHDLLVFNRTAGKAADLEKAGAKTAATVADACKDRDIVITMVSDDAALNEVALGAGGIRQSLPRGGVHVAMGTHSAARDPGARGRACRERPDAGGRAGARPS